MQAQQHPPPPQRSPLKGWDTAPRLLPWPFRSPVGAGVMLGGEGGGGHWCWGGLAEHPGGCSVGGLEWLDRLCPAPPRCTHVEQVLASTALRGPAGSQQVQCHVPASPVWCPSKPSAVFQKSQCCAPVSPVLCPSKPSAASKQAQYGAPAIPVPCPNKASVVFHQDQCHTPASSVPCASNPSASPQ